MSSCVGQWPVWPLGPLSSQWFLGAPCCLPNTQPTCRQTDTSSRRHTILLSTILNRTCWALELVTPPCMGYHKYSDWMLIDYHFDGAFVFINQRFFFMLCIAEAGVNSLHLDACCLSLDAVKIMRLMIQQQMLGLWKKLAYSWIAKFVLHHLDVSLI